jgi:hypothetical protein
MIISGVNAGTASFRTVVQVVVHRNRYRSLPYLLNYSLIEN